MRKRNERLPWQWQRLTKYCCNTNGWELEEILQPGCVSQTGVKFLREPFNLQRQFTGFLLPGPQPPSCHNLPWSLALAMGVSVHLWAPSGDGSARTQVQWQVAPPPCQHSRSPVSSLPFLIYLFFSHLRLRYLHVVWIQTSFQTSASAKFQCRNLGFCDWRQIEPAFKNQ